MVPIRILLKQSLLYRLLPRGLVGLEKIEGLGAQQPPLPGPSFSSAPKSALVLYHGMGGGSDKLALDDVRALESDGYKVSLLTFQVLRRRFVLYPAGPSGKREYFYVPFQLGALWQ